MDSKRLKCIDVIVTGKNDNYEVSAVRHVSSPLYVVHAKSILIHRLFDRFPDLTFHFNVVRVYE